ncbi:MAG: DMT family transporter [Acidobacteria bacterium]|nr:DMT family transporter [Acidobacteriota bacterium]
MSNQSRGEIAIAVSAMIWGSTFVVAKEAFRDISPILFLVIRFAAGALLLTFWIRKRPSRQMVKAGLLIGTIVGCGMILQMSGLKLSSASNVGFLTSLYIPLVPFVGALVYGVRTGWKELLAVAIASVGLGLMSFDPSSFSVNRGDLMTVAAAVLFAFQIVLVSRLGVEGEEVWMAWFQVAMTAVVSGIALPMESSYIQWTMSLVWSMAISVIGSTVAAFLLQSYGQRRTTATRAALIFATEPVFAGMASYYWLGERLTMRGWIGAALVMFGVLLAEFKPGGEKEHSSK